MKKGAPERFRFRLYIAGDGPNSARAVANLHALCSKHLPECHDIEIVDVLVAPERALADRVLLTPLLVKTDPPPARRIVGTLNHGAAVLRTLGLPA
jgi:circadian clock protein KaiB